MSVGGSTGTGGSSSGLGGTTNSYGTILGSPAAAKLVDLTKNCTAANKIASDTDKFQTDSGTVVHVCTLKGGAGNPSGAAYYTADMDIDCDGQKSTHCPGTGAEKDPSYFDETAFSGLDGKPLTAENTPYVVIPEEVKIPGLDQNGSGGNIVAVIYKGQIEFAVWGDTIAYQSGDSSEPIGEASVRTAVGLGIPSSPASGGVGSGVTYIAFAGTDAQPKNLEDLAEVQALGQKLLLSLLQNNP
jgi:Fungal chitosanase of glycosyl hydrolase group 75